MALPLPILPASQRFYEPVKVIDIAPGQTIDGRWIPGVRTERTIMGSIQAKSNRRLGMQAAGDAGQGECTLYTHTDLTLYDIESGGQTIIESRGRFWRVVGEQSWGTIAHNLHNYQCQRYDGDLTNTEQGDDTEPVETEIP